MHKEKDAGSCSSLEPAPSLAGTSSADAPHSPLPWRHLHGDVEIIEDSSDWGARAIAWSDADFDLIVRAVNSHDELVAALQAARALIADEPRQGGKTWTLKTIIAALAKAEGKP